MVTPLIIKNKGIQIAEVLRFAFLLLILSMYPRVSSNIMLLLIPLIALAIFGWMTYQRIKDRSPKIIIDDTGVQLPVKNKNYLWDELQFVYVLRVREKRGKKYLEVPYLIVQTHDIERKIELSEFKYSAAEIAEAVEFFSGRDIGEYEDRKRVELAKLIGKNGNVNQILPALEKAKKKLKWQLYSLFILCIPVTLFLELLGVAYIFPIGCIVYALGYKFFTDSTQAKLSHLPAFAQIDLAQFIVLTTWYKVYRPKWWQYIVIGLFITLAIFAIVLIPQFSGT